MIEIERIITILKRKDLQLQKEGTKLFKFPMKYISDCLQDGFIEGKVMFGD